MKSESNPIRYIADKAAEKDWTFKPLTWSLVMNRWSLKKKQKVSLLVRNGIYIQCIDNSAKWRREMHRRSLTQ